jgi:tetratricopeptide (TPR) repeat protein
MGLDLAVLGDVARAQGAYSEALAQYQQCLSLWRERGNTVNTAVVFDSIGQALSQMDDPARAVTLFSAAAAIRARAGVKLTANEQASCDATIGACRTTLGEGAFGAAWATGRTLTMAQAIELALQPVALTAA